MNPALSSFRNEPVIHQRLPTFERPSKRPRQNSIVHPRGPHASLPSELPSKYRKLTDGRSLPLPSRESVSQNRVPISALLSLRPPGSPTSTPAFADKPQLPKLNEVLMSSAHVASGIRAETLSPLSLVSNQAVTSKGDAPSHLPKVMSTSPISTQLGTGQEAAAPPQLVPKLPAPVVSAAPRAKRKVIPCPYQFCQKKFSRNSNLKVHMRIHTKTYPFACNLCEREFMWSSSLHWHTKWHEKVAMKEAAKKKQSEGVASNSATGTGQECTCTCVCPVHKTKPITSGAKGVENAKPEVLQPRINAPSTQ